MAKLNLQEAAAEILNKSVKDAGSEKGGVIKDKEENDTGDAVVHPTKNDGEKDYDKDVDKNEDEQTDDAEAGDTKAPKGKKPEDATKNPKMAAEAKDNDKEEDDDDSEDDEDDDGDSADDDTDNDKKDDVEVDGDEKKIGDKKKMDEKKKSMKEERRSVSAILDEKVKYSGNADVAKIFKGTDLSEEFIEKATTIFEAAVKSKIKAVSKALAEEADKIISEEVEKLDEEISEGINDFMKLIAREWLSENQVAIESNMRTELTEDFIVGLRNLFAESYIDVPEEKIDIVSEIQDANAQLKAELDEEVAEKLENYKYIRELEDKLALNDLAEDYSLTVSQREKLKELAEDVEADNVDKFKAKLTTLIESYVTDNTTKSSEKIIKEETDDEIVTDAAVEAMAKSIRKFR